MVERRGVIEVWREFASVMRVRFERVLDISLEVGVVRAG